MKELAFTNIVQMVCGQTFAIDFLEKVALGIFEPEKFTQASAIIPGTLSLCKTAASSFILETTICQNSTRKLETINRFIPATGAQPLIEAGGANIFPN